jgi:decaprenyl-phosphate phosphoribosyltransferase
MFGDLRKVNKKMKSFLEIDFGNLNSSTLIIDIDGTMVPDKSNKISKTIVEKIKELAHSNKIYLCSNRSTENVLSFAKITSTEAMLGKKPFSVKIPDINKDSRIVVIGDKYLTDGLFAKHINAEFLKVKRLVSESDSLLIKLSYIIDDLVDSIISYLYLIRPWQWVKNLLVFAPVFFIGSVAFKDKFILTLGAFIAFSIAASSVYILNDIFDRKTDKLHPKKKNRPIASGAITLKNATTFLIIMLVVEFFLLSFEPVIAPIILIYILLNIAYTTWFKHIAIIDIICVASFYMMRIVAGGVVVGVPLSSWIMLCTFFGALFVIVGKRCAEFRNDNRRKVLEQYSKTALDFMLGTSAGLAIIAYSIWSILAHNSPYLVYSTVFVILALFRMLNHIYTSNSEGESPEFLVFKDKWILGSFLLWVVYVGFIFY